jgi:type I restriction enzyme, R subunit
VRKKIIKEQLIDPAFYKEMSKLLGVIIKERKNNAISYEKYLLKIAELAKKLSGAARDDMPAGIKTPAQRALYSNMGKNEDRALAVDEAVKKARYADWRGNPQKENEIKAELFKVLNDVDEVERIFLIIKQQGEY